MNRGIDLISVINKQSEPGVSVQSIRSVYMLNDVVSGKLLSLVAMLTNLSFHDRFWCGN